MRLLDLFKFNPRKKAKARRGRPPGKTQGKRRKKRQTIRADLKKIAAHLKTVDIALAGHDKQLSQHSELINSQSQTLKKLEEIAEENKARAFAGQPGLSARPVGPPASTAAEPSRGSNSARLDVNRFSEQEKRILAAFFHNNDIALSYVDIARALNKSPHTVKNQMNQMKLKADLFERSVDKDSRKRFRLKDGLKIQKYLSVS